MSALPTSFLFNGGSSSSCEKETDRVPKRQYPNGMNLNPNLSLDLGGFQPQLFSFGSPSSGLPSWSGSVDAVDEPPEEEKKAPVRGGRPQNLLVPPRMTFPHGNDEDDGMDIEGGASSATSPVVHTRRGGREFTANDLRSLSLNESRYSTQHASPLFSRSANSATVTKSIQKSWSKNNNGRTKRRHQRIRSSDDLCDLPRNRGSSSSSPSFFQFSSDAFVLGHENKESKSVKKTRLSLSPSPSSSSSSLFSMDTTQPLFPSPTPPTWHNNFTGNHDHAHNSNTNHQHQHQHHHNKKINIHTAQNPPSSSGFTSWMDRVLMRLRVRLPNGENLLLRVYPSTSGIELKQLIGEETGIDTESCALFFRGRAVGDLDTMSDAGLRDRSELFVISQYGL